MSERSDYTVNRGSKRHMLEIRRNGEPVTEVPRKVLKEIARTIDVWSLPPGDPRRRAARKQED